jgi:hypothetical protein
LGKTASSGSRFFMINDLIKSLSAIDNVVGIVYGGSRGIGIHNQDSDHDIVLYDDDENRISNAVLLQHIPEIFKLDVKPALISGYAGDFKFEIFQKSLKKVQAEINNNIQGRFNWKLAPLFPFGDLSYRQVSHLVNSKVLWDRDGELLSTINLVNPIPKLFKKSVVEHFFKQINNTLIHFAKVKKKEDQFHLMSLMGLIFFCYVNILYVANNRYPITEKGNFLVATSLPNIPTDFIQRISNVYSAASAFEYDNARVLLKALVAELKSIVYEDQKK